MQLNITTDYALRVLLYLHQTGGNANSDSIAEEMAIPRQYLIKVLTRLRRGGIIASDTGPLGGYYLAVPLSEITVMQIYDIMEQSTRINRCLEENAPCGRNAQTDCPMRKFYTAMQNHMDSYWFSMTLQQILDTFDK